MMELRNRVGLLIGLIAAAALAHGAAPTYGTLAAPDGMRGIMGAQACPTSPDRGSGTASAPDTAAIRLVLNIPAFRVDVVRAGRVVRTFPVAVGAPRWPTPVGRYVVDEITWNPRWVPPPSDWAKDEKPMAPGPNNPMGRVKLRFAPYYYLHGTPFENSIGTVGSHGCVRLRNADAIELARLVQREGLPGQGDRGVAGWLAESHRTRIVGLERVVPFEAVYEPVEVRGDSLLVHSDVYRRLKRSIPEEARVVLEAHGYEPELIDAERLATLVRSARSGPIAVPLASVLKQSKEEDRSDGGDRQ